MISHIVRELLLPPATLLMLLALSFVLRRSKPRLAAGVFWSAWGLLYLLSVPLVSVWLARSTETYPPMSLTEAHEFAPQAIVILGGGVDFDAPEYGGRSVPSMGSLKRISYAEYLGKELKVPIITTGGYGETVEDAEGTTAARHLQDHGYRDPILVESRSQTTAENARLSREIAEPKGINRVLLVTAASHAARAQAAFKKAGFEVKVAPTGFRDDQPWERGILLVIPTHSHFDESCRALRAYLGLLYESLRR